MLSKKKKKILFLMPYLGCGGVESTLFSLLDAMDRSRFEITLLLVEKKGEFLSKIPADINVQEISIPEKEQGIFFGKKQKLLQYIKSGKLWKIPSFIAYNSKFSLSEDRTKNAEYFDKISKSIPPLNEEFDLAIDYFGYATFTTFYLAEKVNAKVKVSWLHSIFSRFKPQAFAKWYEKMDVIFSVSKMVGEDFARLFPTVKTIKPFYNIIEPEKIRHLANQAGGFDDHFDGLRILTVGRICHEKGMDLAVESFRRLLSLNYPIRWYLIGGGSAEELAKLETLLKTPKEKESFVFLGIQKNPYVYMRQCDIYVQPSRFEGYCTTTNEARILGCPIVMTNVSGAEEQIKNGETGYIVAQDPSSITQAVEKLILDPNCGENFKNNLLKLDFSTKNELDKLYQLLN